MLPRIAGAAALAALFLAGAAPAHAVTGTQSVTADVANTLEATFPGAYAWGDLVPDPAGATSSAQTINVKSNAAWGVQVATDHADGRMRQHDGTSYVTSPKVLSNALQWRLSTIGGVAQSTSFAALSSTPAAATTLQAVTTDSGTNLGVLLKQVISYADERVSPNTYRVQLTYDAAQGY